MPDVILPLVYGLTGTEEVQVPAFSEGTVNFYYDNDGYLSNYPGRTDLFRRDLALPAYVGTPPTTGTDITRVKTFRDQFGVEHIVFVRGAELCLKYGNGYQVLYTFIGVNEGGLYFPDLFVFQSKLIIVNFGDPVLIWDGSDKVHPLGVLESPVAPDVRSHPAPGTDYNIDHGIWQFPETWWPQRRPQSYPTANEDEDGARIWGIYTVRLQYQDKYGNKGRAGAESKIIHVKPVYEISGLTASGGAFLYTFWNVHFLCVSFYPPMVDEHIHSMILGRTVNLETSDPQGGRDAFGIYYEEKYFDNTTIGRFVCQISDTMLIESGFMDLSVGPPSQASGGCTFNSRIFLWGHEDQHLLTWSDAELMGQYRPLQSYRAVDHIKKAIPVNDRIVVITRSTTEIMYESESGMSILEQDFENGSMWGRSFVDVGGAIFGLWNKGFGFYDGKAHTYIETPYYIKDVYIDNRFNVHSAEKWNNLYILTIRRNDAGAAENDRLIVYNFDTKQWFIINDSVYDLTVWRGSIIGCDDSLYELFKGTYPNLSKFVIKGFVPEGSLISNTRVIDDVKILAEPSSNVNATIDIKSELGIQSQTSREAALMPSKNAINKSGHMEKVWNDTNLLYADSPSWTAPSDFWLDSVNGDPVSGMSHRIECTVPSGHRVRMKALLLSFSERTEEDRAF